MDAETPEPKQKKYRARDFALSAMACPSCRLNFEEAVTACPRCGFDGAAAIREFPFPAPEIRDLIDPAQVLSEDEAAAVATRLRKFEKKFPQVRVSFCFMPPDLECELREFGFWLLNASPLGEENGAEERPWTLLVLLDPARGQISLSSGYAVEPFLRDESALALFKKERAGLSGQDFPAVLPRLVDGLEGILRDGARRVTESLAGKERG